MKMRNFLIGVSLGFGWCFSAMAGEKLHVTGMTCGGCAQAIRAQLANYPEIDKVEIDVKKGVVAVEFKESKTLPRAQIIEAIEKRGFKVKKESGV
jgi:copper chaperone CopZ